MSRSQINTFHFCALLLIIAIWFLPTTPFFTAIKPLHVLVVSFFILVVPGVSLVYCFEKITHHNYDLSVFLSLSILSSLFVPPFLLVLLYEQVGHIDVPLILLVYTSFLLLPYVLRLSWFILRRWLPTPSNQLLTFPPLSLSSTLTHPFFIVCILFISVQLFNLTRFSFLPVPDSYSWLIEFSGKFSIDQLPLTGDYTRRSFSAFIAAFYYLSHIDLFLTFKYVFPFLSLCVISPLWLAARYLPQRRYQALFLFSAVFISPTIILELSYIRQQVIFLIFLYFMVGLQVYAIDSKDKSIFYLLFLFSLLGTTVHPAFLIIVLTNLISFFLAHLKLFWRHQTITILIIILLYPLAKKAFIVNMFIRINEQARASLSNLIAGSWNLSFPSYYFSSDGYEMGWPGLLGVLKYYSYYVGPVSLTILLLSILWFFRFKLWHHVNLVKAHAALFISIIVPFTLFFLIAEIAPRFGNIAFLPERAWQYLSILSVFALFFLLKASTYTRPYFSSHQLFLPLILTSFTFISVFGAIYINNLNQYLIPDYEFTAARWLVNNVSNNSVVYSSTSKNIIRYHADKHFIGLDDTMYNESDPIVIINHLSAQLDLESEVSANLVSASAELSTIISQAADIKTFLDEKIQHRHISMDTYNLTNTALTKIQSRVNLAIENINDARDFHSTHSLFLDNLPPLYIYYSTTNPYNPMSNRPYKSSFTANLNISSFPALDNNPQYFSRVYTDNNNVIIWRINLKSFLKP